VRFSWKLTVGVVLLALCIAGAAVLYVSKDWLVATGVRVGIHAYNARLNSTLSVQAASFDLLTRTLTLRGVTIAERGNTPLDPPVTVRMVVAKIELWRLLKRQVVLTEVFGSEAVVRYEIDAENRSNIEELFRLRKKDEPDKPSPWNVIIRRCVLQQGMITAAMTSQPVRATLNDVTLAASFTHRPRHLHVELTNGQGEVGYRFGRDRLRHRLLQTIASVDLFKDRMTLREVRAITPEFTVVGQGVVEREHIEAQFEADVPLTLASVFVPELPPALGTLSLKGSLEGAMKHPELHLSLQGEQLGLGPFSLTDLSASLSLSQQRLRITRAALGVLDGRVLGTGVLELGQSHPERPRLDIQLELSDLPIIELLSLAGVATPPLAGRVTGHVAIIDPTFDLDRMRAQGHLTLAPPAVQTSDARQRFPLPLSLTTGFRYADRTVMLDDTAWALDGAKGKLAGTLHLGGETHLSGTAEAALGAQLFASLGLPAMRGAANLAFQVQGDIRQPRVEADFELQNVQYQDLRLEHLRLSLAAAHSEVKLLSLSASQGRARYHLVGDVKLAAPLTRLHLPAAPFPILAISGLRVRVEHMDLATLPAFLPLPLAGELTLSAALEGPWSALRGEGSIDIRGLVVQGERIDDLSLLIEGSSTQAQLKRLTATVGGGQLQATGTVTFPRRVEVALEWRGVELAQLALPQRMNLPLAGPLSGSIRAAGLWPELKGDISVQSPRLTAFQMDMTALQVHALATPHELTLERFTTRIAGAPLTAAGRIAVAGPLDVRLSSEQIPLRNFPLLPKEFPLRGGVKVSLQGGGTLARPVVRGQVHLSGVQAGGMRVGTGDLTLALDDRRVTFSTQGLEGLSLNGWLLLEQGLPAQLRLAVRSMDLGRLTALLKPGGPVGPIEGDVTGTLEVNGQLRALPTLAGSILVEQLRIRSNGTELRNAGPLRWQLAQGVLAFEAVRLRGQGANLDMRGSVNLPEEALDIAIVGTGPLTLIGGRVPEVRFPQGVVEARLHLRGPLRQPIFDGQVLLRDGVVQIPALNESLSHLKGEILLAERTIAIQSLEGKMAGGDVKVSGQLVLEGYRLQQISLTTQANQVRLRYPANFSALVNAELVLTGNSEAQQLTGEVGLARARYREEIDLTAWILQYRRRELEPPRLQRESPQLDLRVHTTDPLRVDNRMAKLDVTVDVTVRGSPNQPVILGRVEVEKGTATVVGNRFTELAGSVDFLNPTRIEPFFDIRTDTQKSGYKIHVTATGTPQQFDLHLSSDPPLNEEDLFALLALGATGEALITAAGATLPRQLSAFLTGQLAEEIGRGVGTFVGVDRLELDPISGGKHGLAGPKVTVGKDLSRALSVTYSTTFGPARENLVSLEYRVTDSISLIGMRDERGDVGVDLKFSFRFE